MMINIECQVDRNEHYRHHLLFAFNRGTSASEAAREICDVYGERAMPGWKARNWFARFKSGNFDLKDKNQTCDVEVKEEQKVEVDDEEDEKFDDATENPPQSSEPSEQPVQRDHKMILRHLYSSKVSSVVTFDKGASKNRKSHYVLWHDGYRFIRKKTTASTEYWICEASNCLVKAQTPKGELIGAITGSHNHENNRQKQKIENQIKEACDKARNSFATTRRLVNDVKAALMADEDLVGCLPTDRSIEERIRRARNRKSMANWKRDAQLEALTRLIAPNEGPKCVNAAMAKDGSPCDDSPPSDPAS